METFWAVMSYVVLAGLLSAPVLAVLLLAHASRSRTR
jgi:hypothetical protein